MSEALSQQMQSASLADGGPVATNTTQAPVPPQQSSPPEASQPGDVSVESNSAPMSNPNDVSVRALVSSRAAGIIIGRGGQAVAEVRNQTGVRAGVSKSVPGVMDRVLSITGTPDAVSKAILMISSQLVESLSAEQQPGGPPASISFLIPHLAMGAIIGKAGAKIKEIQDASGARMVASKEMLPQSTERVVDVSGTPDNVAHASKCIAEALLAEADKLHGTVLFHPQAIGPEGPAPGAHLGAAAGMYGQLSVLGGYQQPPSSSHPAGRSASGAGARRVSSFGGARTVSGGARMSAAAAAGMPTTPSSATFSMPPTSPPVQPGADFNDPSLRTQQISFPADMIGCIIGKGGTKISEIRRLSGSRINIAREPNASGERLFSIVGTTESNEKALYLLYSSLEAEKERRSQQETDLAPQAMAPPQPAA